MASHLGSQLSELALLRAMYADAAWTWLHNDPAIREQWEGAVQAAVDGCEPHCDNAFPGQFRFSIDITDIVQASRPVTLEIHLPVAYPAVAPNIRPEGLNLPRKQQDALNAQTLALQQGHNGGKYLSKHASVVQLVSDLISEIQAVVLAAPQSPTDGLCKVKDHAHVPTRAKSAMEAGITRVLLWMHHLLSTTKRKFICQWSKELGLSKPGYPGILVAEGPSDAVNEYVRRLKALRWQAITVRWQEVQALPLQTLDHRPHCRLATAFSESGVQEVETMSDVAVIMERAGLKDAFLAAMKISKP
ncbi:hypothetical protein H4R34_004274 [Dimargaris verticillata]|uniref:RWD domain-containing protein n=1 Tax=Dimargaris verticillata TaxID=2761393 RepID=A0A9W8AZ96_9FUNG|nr:hypothetical protein H4R34_004274 [Dimargaris verticillata]